MAAIQREYPTLLLHLSPILHPLGVKEVLEVLHMKNYYFSSSFTLSPTYVRAKKKTACVRAWGRGEGS